MSERIELRATLPATAEAVFDAWIDGEAHGAMTGAGATSDPKAGGRFTAWDGYIEGTHVELVRPRRIVQRWRTSQFPDDAPDSILEIELTPKGSQVELHMVHRDIPDGQGADYEQGWSDHYFEPMREHFGDRS
ncbi:MAG: SRPBCC domain-containing protein [Sandaracinaceae bacterium]|nr:SRPBCC domain-containing protein [Sandaracinaceae bacterium]